MGKSDLDALRERAKKGEIDRTSLIRALRKVRLEAVNKNDREVLDALQDPPEIVADRLLHPEK